MSKLKWDEVGERTYETGVKNGVHYTRDDKGIYPKGVAWNGLTAVTESPSGAEATPLYADDIKYINLMGTEEFGATIEAYTYPDEFALCDGSAEIAEGVSIGQQPRKTFGLSYKTILGNDVDGEGHGYKLHLVYGALAGPSEKSYATVNESPEATTFSWEITTTPVPVINHKPTAIVTIVSTDVTPEKLKIIEDILYGIDAVEAVEANESEGVIAVEAVAAVDPRLPLPNELITIMAVA